MRQVLYASGWVGPDQRTKIAVPGESEARGGGSGFQFFHHYYNVIGKVQGDSKKTGDFFTTTTNRLRASDIPK
jgi:hypothetical protein